MSQSECSHGNLMCDFCGEYMNTHRDELVWRLERAKELQAGAESQAARWLAQRETMAAALRVAVQQLRGYTHSAFAPDGLLDAIVQAERALGEKP